MLFISALAVFAVVAGASAKEDGMGGGFAYAVDGIYTNCPAFPKGKTADSTFSLVQGVSSGKTARAVCTYITGDEKTTVPCTYNTNTVRAGPQLELNSQGKLVKGLGVSFKFCPAQTYSVTRTNVAPADLACYSVCPPSYKAYANKAYMFVDGSLTTANYEDPSQGTVPVTACNYVRPSGKKFTCSFNGKTGKLIKGAKADCGGFTADGTKHLSHCYSNDQISAPSSSKAKKIA